MNKEDWAMGVITLLAGVVVWLFAAVVTAEEQYLFVDDVSGKVFLGSTNNPANVKGLTEQWFQGVSLDNAVRTNFFLIKELGDFPTPTNGCITLATNSIYEINGTVMLGTNVICMDNDSWLRGQARALDAIVYSGTNWAVIGTNGASIGVSELGFLANNGGSFGMFTSPDGLTNGVTIRNMILNDTKHVLCYSNYTLINIDNLLVRQYTGDFGIKFDGADDAFLNVNDLILWETAAGSTAIDLGSSVWLHPTFDEIFVTTPSNGVGLLAMTNSFNVSTNGLGAVRSSIFNNNTGDTGTNVIGITQNDARWEISGNPGVAESAAITSMFVTNDTTVVISIVNTPTAIAGSWVQDASAGFLFDTNGTLTYNKTLSKTLSGSLAISLEPASGNRDLNVYIGINDVMIPLSKAGQQIGTGSPQTIVIFDTLTLELGDTVRIFVENESGTQNITVHSVKFILTSG